MSDRCRQTRIDGLRRVTSSLGCCVFVVLSCSRSAPPPFDFGDPDAIRASRAATTRTVPRGEEEIRGRVIALGQPVAGASVVATRVVDKLLSERPCPCGPDCGPSLLDCPCAEATQHLVALLARRVGEAVVVARATTGEDGSFTLTGLAPGRHSVWATASETGAALRSGVVAGGEVTLDLLPRKTWRSELLDDERVPLAGAFVALVHRSEGRVLEATTASDGSFLMEPVPSDDYVVIGTAKGVRPQVFGRMWPEYDFPKTTSLQGIVLSEGYGVANAKVHVVEPSGRDRQCATTVRSDAFGRFETPVSDWSSVSMWAEHEGSVTRSSHFYRQELLDTHKLELTPAGALLVRIRDAVTGRPIEGARVSLFLETPRAPDFRSALISRGVARFDALVPGTWRATVESARHETQNVSVTVDARKTVRVDIRLRPAPMLEGRVVDESGQPQADVVVYVSGARELGREDFRTTSDGTFSLKVAAGPHVVTAKHRAFQTVHRKVTVPESGVELVLRRGARLEITFDPPEKGRRFAASAVREGPAAIDGAGAGDQDRDLRYGRDEGDREIIDGVAEGLWLVIAESWAQSVRRTVEIRGFGRTVVTLRIPENPHAIRGRVVDGAGAPLTVPCVLARHLPDTTDPPRPLLCGLISNTPRWCPAAPLACVPTRSDGSFVIDRVHHGRWMLDLGDGSHHTAPVVVESGATNVVLRGWPRSIVRGRVLGDGPVPVGFKVMRIQRYDGFSEWRSSVKGVEDRFVTSWSPGEMLVLHADGWRETVLQPLFLGSDVDLGVVPMDEERMPALHWERSLNLTTWHEP